MSPGRRTLRARVELPTWVLAGAARVGGFVTTVGTGVTLISLGFGLGSPDVGIALVVVGYLTLSFPEWYVEGVVGSSPRGTAQGTPDGSAEDDAGSPP